MQKKTVRRIETDPGDPINFGAARWWLFYSAEKQPFATIDKKFPKKKHCRLGKKLDLRAVEIIKRQEDVAPKATFFVSRNKNNNRPYEWASRKVPKVIRWPQPRDA